MKNLALSLLLLGCGSSIPQTTLNGVAQIGLVDTQDIRVAFHVGRDRFCRQEHPPSDSVFSDWEACMTPSVRLDSAVSVATSYLRAAQAGLDAYGEDGFRAMLPDLVVAASNLLEVLLELGIPVPDEVRHLVALGSLL